MMQQQNLVASLHQNSVPQQDSPPQPHVAQQLAALLAQHKMTQNQNLHQQNHDPNAGQNGNFLAGLNLNSINLNQNVNQNQNLNGISSLDGLNSNGMHGASQDLMARVHLFAQLQVPFLSFPSSGFSPGLSPSPAAHLW